MAGLAEAQRAHGRGRATIIEAGRGRAMIITITITLVMLMLGVAAHAQPGASDREEARRAFAAGQAADRQRDWQTAIDHYLRANDLVPHPNTMFNIAVDYERLGKLREAAAWYQRYIDAAPDSPDRDRVIRSLGELRQRPGTLTVRSVPDGARVWIDRREVGVTPYSGHLAGGDHVIRIEHGELREERKVTIEYGEPAIVDVALRGATGTLRVVGSPPGALVTVDDAPAGPMPIAIPLAPGDHAVVVSAQGHVTFETTARIVPNRITVVRAQLPRSLGFGETQSPTTLAIGYLVGATGGVDAAGDGALGLFEFGVRLGQFDGSIRFGKTVGFTVYDLVARWTVGNARFAPFASVGYTIITRGESTSDTGAGFLATGGLRYDLARRERYAMSVLAESGVRSYRVGPTGNEKTQMVVPVMTSFQIMYK
jgi:hypothetical protein